jgi:Zn-finger nucleic acid-binding protein
MPKPLWNYIDNLSGGGYGLVNSWRVRSNGKESPMMNCPVCDVPLARVPYEGFPVWTCGQCHGHFADTARIETIKNTTRLSTAELKEEAKAEYRNESEKSLRCPRCLRAMEKKRLNEKWNFIIDYCAPCDWTWFDGGELAILQLLYEDTPAARDRAEFKRRIAEMTPARLRQYEENLAKMPFDTSGRFEIDDFLASMAIAQHLI